MSSVRTRPAARPPELPDAASASGVVRRWLVGWSGLAVAGIANGAVREATYAHWTGEGTAHAVSTLALLGISAAYVGWLQGRWPLPSSPVAWRIGAVWMLLTLAFEFGFGHYVAGTSWSELLADYNLLKGRLWALVPLWILVAPAVVRRLRRAAR